MTDWWTKREDGNGALDLGTFVRGSAHEFANPLNAIGMQAELAKSLFGRDEHARALEAIERLLVNCALCGRLLQSFRRFGAGLRALPGERASVREIVNSAIEMATFERRTLPAVEVEEADLWTFGDKLALGRALAELLFNAAEAQAHTVRISMRREGPSIIVDVVDDGMGVAPDLRDKITQPFFSTRRNEGKAGLGLNLVQEVLSTNGGALQINATSAKGTGTCMRLRLSPYEACTA